MAAAGAERNTLMTQCQSNLALCHLKQGQNEDCVTTCNEILSRDGKAVKALFRRGQARAALGKHIVAYQDMKYALTLAPSDEALKKEHDKVAFLCLCIQRAARVSQRSRDKRTRHF